ncbi:MAG: hypothetical protein JSR61_04410 [Proteobacteria bacterium]|nr:hypothetical protein [Pseudomonadota bacterium]
MTLAFDIAAKLVALISFGGLMLSVIYEWAYFSIIGREYQRLAVAGDYLANAVEWLPAVLGGYFIMWIVHLVLRRTEHWLSEEEIVQSTSSPEGTRKLRRRPFVLMAYLFPATAIFSVMFFPPMVWPYFFSIGLSALWPFLVIYIFNHENARAWGTQLRPLIVIVPLVIFAVYFSGRARAYADLVSKEQGHSLLRSSGQQEPVLLLRSFSKGLLVKNAQSGQLEFVKWEDVRVLASDYFAGIGESLFCKWSGILCAASKSGVEPK